MKNNPFHHDDAYILFHNKTGKIKTNKIADGMRILIPSYFKKTVLIRKINKYFKENNIDAKIVNKKSDANTISIPVDNFVNKKKPYVLDDDNQVKIVASALSYSYKLRTLLPIAGVKTAYSVSNWRKYCSKLSSEDTYNYYHSDKVCHFKHVVCIKELKEISKIQLFKDKKKASFDPEKVKAMLINIDTAKLFHDASKNTDLKPYMEQIVEAYYETRSGKCRSIILNGILNRYPQKNRFNRLSSSETNTFVKCRCYMQTMKSLGMTPKKEFILELINYYDYL